MHEKSGKSAMSVVEIANRMVSWEIQTARTKRPHAERQVSMRAGLSPSAIENLRKGKLKDERRVAGPIRDLFIRFLERKISALQTELALARAMEPDRDFRKVEAAIAAAQAALGRREIDEEFQGSRGPE